MISNCTAANWVTHYQLAIQSEVTKWKNYAVNIRIARRATPKKIQK